MLAKIRERCCKNQEPYSIPHLTLPHSQESCKLPGDPRLPPSAVCYGHHRFSWNLLDYFRCLVVVIEALPHYCPPPYFYPSLRLWKHPKPIHEQAVPNEGHLKGCRVIHCDLRIYGVFGLCLRVFTRFCAARREHGRYFEYHVGYKV